MVDNDNHLSIDVVDREWYIAVTEKRIMDFLGQKIKRHTQKVNKVKRELTALLES